MRESNPRPSDFPVRPVSRRRRSCASGGVRTHASEEIGA